jgi:drug/metabolite transporter (DMT)-like permease
MPVIETQPDSNPGSTQESSQTLLRLKIQAVLPYLGLAGGVLALSMSAIFIRQAQAPSTVTTFYRMTIAALFLLPFFLKNARTENWQNGRIWIPLVLLAGAFTAFDHGSWSLALEGTSVANATLFNNIAPVWVALVTFFLWKQKLTRRFWVGLVLTMAGAAYILGSQMLTSQRLSPGDMWGVASSLFYAGYFLVTQRVRTHIKTLTHIWFVATTASVILLIFNLIVQRPLTGFSTSTYLFFIAAALVSQVGGYFSVAYALGHLPAAVVAPTMILQPVLTSLLAIPFAGEPLSSGQIIGGISVLCGIYLINRAS